MACGYAYSILADFHLAEDAAQEAFIVAFERLGQLERPEAFPGWFRRIVWSSCGRMVRQKTVPTVALETAVSLPSEANEPLMDLEQDEMRNEVLKAVHGLPAAEREVTTLFYINGYSQADIADFLEVPIGTVKNRLNASRGRLKERMLNMVKQTLHDSTPKPEFRDRIIEELVNRPRPMELPEHPIRRVCDAVRAAFVGYEWIGADEEIVDAASPGVGQDQYHSFRVDEYKVLRTETTTATFRGMVGRKPPVHLIAAGRVFRNDPEDASHLKVFHQLDLVCIESGANAEAMKVALQKAIEAVLGQTAFRYEPGEYSGVESCLDVSIRAGERWIEIAGCGVLATETLRLAGFSPQEVGGYAFGLGVERLAMLRFGIVDIRQLWQPPYVK
jgi:phenylalanyl-tRNA synthetase alpha chain